MRLNGWQRLWIVLVAGWAVPVLIVSYELWPRPPAKADIYTRMKQDDGHRLLDFYDVIATSIGGTNEDIDPKIAKLTRDDKQFMTASPEEQKGYLAYVDPSFPKTPLEQNAYLAHVTGKGGTVVEISGDTLQFVPGLSQQDQDKTLTAYRRARFHILAVKRSELMGEALAVWLVPAAALYALGWAVGWVRRGFQNSGGVHVR